MRPAAPRPTSRIRKIASLGIVLLGLAAVAAAREKTPVFVVPADEREHRSEQIREAMDRYAAAGATPFPTLDGENLEKLLNGEVVRFREKSILSSEGDKESERTRQRALAYRLVGSPRKQVWIAAVDPHYPANDDLTEIRMDEDVSGSSTWYQFIDLPWPVRNRHWVIDVAKDPAVTDSTSGQAWVHSWKLVKDGEGRALEWGADGRAKPLSLDDVKGARYLEENDGAWVMFELEENVTLLAYHVTIVLGGWIPEGMASRFAMRALEDLLDRVARNAEQVPAHYVEGHVPIFAGDTLPLETFAADSTVAH